jgi:hypothetical protein
MPEELECGSSEAPLEQRSEQRCERDERGRFSKGNIHRWQPGESGNQHGRRDALTDTLRRKLGERHDDARTRREALVDSLIDEACNGSIRAAELIFLRLEGRMPASLDLNISRSEYELAEQRVAELRQIADNRGTPISRGKAIKLLAQADPRILTILGDSDE